MSQLNKTKNRKGLQNKAGNKSYNKHLLQRQPSNNFKYSRFGKFNKIVKA